MAASVALCGAAGLVALAASAGAARPTSLAFKLPPYPVEHFSWKNEAPTDPPCDTNGCAFRDQYFTVDDWDQLCLQHCGDIDALLKEVQGRQQGGVQLANRGRTQALVGLEEAPEGMRRMSGPELLVNAGVNTNTWGLEEKEMPEQEPEAHEEREDDHEDDNLWRRESSAVAKAWNDYWDTGNTLHDAGVNVYGAPIAGAEINPTDGRPMREDGVVLDSWPWQSGARVEREGELPNVHVNGWDGDAFSRK